MRYILFLVLLWPVPVMAAGPGRDRFRFEGWVGQTMEYNQLATSAVDTFHSDNLGELHGNGNDVRIGTTEMGLGMQAQSSSGFGGRVRAILSNGDLQEPEFRLHFREAWVGYTHGANTFFAHMGQFAVPTGVEQTDSPNRWMVSSSLVSASLVPASMAGIIAGVKAGKALQFRFWVGGPWNTQTYLLTGAPNFGARLRVRAANNMLFGLHLQYGDRDSGQRFLQRIVAGIDSYLTPLDTLAIGGEFILHAHRHDVAREAFYLYSWATMGMLGWDILDWMRWAIRAEYIADDARAGVSNLFQPDSLGAEQARAGYATAFNFHLPKEITLKIEGRYDHSSQRVFRVGRQMKHGYGSAKLQALYEFER